MSSELSESGKIRGAPRAACVANAGTRRGRRPQPQRAGTAIRAAAILLSAVVAGATAGCRGGPAPTPPPAATPRTADQVIVLKSKRLLELQRAGKVFAAFPIALGPQPRGAKTQEGDGRTPEGHYIVDWRSAHTRYTRELHISYPNAADRARARRLHVNPGGAIFIHGLPRSFGRFDPLRFYRDWTEGCVAVGNVAIDKIWNAVAVGTPVDIRP